MRKLLTAAVLAATLATPALAQTSQALPAQPGLTAAAWDDVVTDGKYLGRDPDANVRLEMRRDVGGVDH